MILATDDALDLDMIEIHLHRGLYEFLSLCQGAFKFAGPEPPAAVQLHGRLKLQYLHGITMDNQEIQ